MEQKRSDEQVIADVLALISEIKKHGKEVFSDFSARLNARTQELAARLGRRNVMNFKLWWLLSGMTLSSKFTYGPEADLPEEDSLEKFVRGYAAELKKPKS